MKRAHRAIVRTILMYSELFGKIGKREKFM